MSINDQKGVGIIGIIIIAALIYAALTVYSYFYPSFQLARYTPTALLNKAQDDQRVKDLEKIAQALDQYYDENRELPGQVGFCSRIVTVVYPTAKDELSPYFPQGIPQDPEHAGTHKDYFYRRDDRDTYILLAVLDNPQSSETYNFEGCHDWPGDNVYNYVLTNN